MRRIILYTLFSILAILLVGAAPLPIQDSPDAPPEVFYLVSGSTQRNVVYESFLLPVT